MDADEAAARELNAAIFRMATSFRRQRGEFMDRSAINYPRAAIAARHMSAAAYVLEEGPITVSALANRLRIELTTASKVVTELEQAGLVYRRRDPEDRRRILIDVVASECDRVAGLMDELLAPLLTTVRQLSAAERKAFLRGLTLYADALDEAPSANPPEPPG